MKKYNVKEFANEIRTKHPGSYDDLSDEKLVELWLKKFPNDKEKITKNSKLKQYKYLFILLGLLMSIVFYVIYLDQKYPKNELELQNLMCDKYWRITDASVEEIYLNNVIVPQPTSDLRKQLSRNINGEESYKLYDILTKLLLSQKNQDSYIYIRKNSNVCEGEFKYLYYDQSFDTESSKLTYTETCMKLDKTNGYYIAKSEDNQYVPEFELVENELVDIPIVNWDNFVKSHSIQIDYLDKEKLDLVICYNIVDDKKQEFKFKVKVRYEQLHLPINPPRFLK
jgi:hypothetical protein